MPIRVHALRGGLCARVVEGGGVARGPRDRGAPMASRAAAITFTTVRAMPWFWYLGAPNSV